MKIYQISGLGANEKAFERLKFSDEFNIIFIPWLIPEKKESLNHYTQRMMESININEEFVLMGLSFGGIVVQEMNQYLKPKHTILLSTIKSRNEMPNYMKLTGKTKLNKVVPIQFFTNETFVSYSFFRKLYDPKMPKLNKFFTMKNHQYLNWSIAQVLNWKPTNSIDNFTHIHGNKDLVFPDKRIQQKELIKDGTHLMVLQKPKQVSAKINEALMKL